MIACLCLASGCGGGGSGERSAKAIARKRAIASARLARGTFAVAGIGRTVGRAAAFRPRLRLILALIKGGRESPPDLDPGTGLYFVKTVDVDGSGREDLFSDASHRKPAGMFAWQAPVWTGGKKNTYPATIHTDYQIDGGEFTGERGTIDFVADDSSGDNGTMHVVLTTHESERVVADFEIKNGKVHAKSKCSLPDGSTWEEVDSEQPDGDVVATIDFPDGSTETITMTPDGDSTEILTAPDGTIDASGDIDSDGMDSITYDDGSQENVDVDTADAGDGGGSGDSDSSDPGSDKSIRRATRANSRIPGKRNR